MAIWKVEFILHLKYSGPSVPESLYMDLTIHGYTVDEIHGYCGTIWIALEASYVYVPGDSGGLS